ncbi:MAG: CinA family protein [Pseudomonadota bacterium]
MPLFDDAIDAAARSTLAACARRGLTLATAESCTGGLLAGALTEIPGSSAVVERGVVTYSNAAKTELLGVPSALFESVGAVSEEVARAMVEGLLARAPVDLALSVTGVAGPGASERKPEGLVFLAVGLRDKEVLIVRETFGAIGRGAVRLNSVRRGLSMLEDMAVLSE